MLTSRFKVFVYSFPGRKAQPHFDGKHMVVGLTKYLDFQEENVDNIKLFLRWMMNEPLGDTTFGSPDALESLMSRSVRTCQFGQWLECIGLISLRHPL